MNTKDIIEVEEEVKRLLKRIQEIKKEWPMTFNTINELSISGCKETAALRRASLDLTRALTKMRKP